MAEVSIAGRHGELPGHLAVPAAAGPWPGVVVIHEAFGLVDDVRRIADRFGDHGYLALAPNLFAWGNSRFACVRAAFRELSVGTGRMFDDLEAARGWLAARDDCTGRVGVIGFCMGGGFALLAAPRYEFGAASVNYGVCRTTPSGCWRAPVRWWRRTAAATGRCAAMPTACEAR
jgi:carboxymethylenebutenolidase